MDIRKFKEPELGDISELNFECSEFIDIKEKSSLIKKAFSWLIIFIVISFSCLFLYEYNRWSPFFTEATIIRIKAAFHYESPDELRKLSAICNTLNLYDYSVKYLKKLLEFDANNINTLANIAINLTKANFHQEAINYYNKMDNLNFVPAADLCFFRAKSLQALNQLEEAFFWHYKSFESADMYIDNLTALLDLHIRLEKPFEALSLIHGYLLKYPNMTAYLSPYESKFSEMTKAATTESMSFRVPETSMHYFVPITFKNKKNVEHYIVDTGATFMTVSKSIKKEELGVYVDTGQILQLHTASNDIVKSKLIIINQIKVGPITLKNVKAVLCPACPNLLGQSVLSQFNTQTKKISGTNFLIMEKR